MILKSQWKVVKMLRQKKYIIRVGSGSQTRKKVGSGSKTFEESGIRIRNSVEIGVQIRKKIVLDAQHWWIQFHFFGFRFGNTGTNILTQIFLKWCLSLQNLYNRGIPVPVRFPTEKHLVGDFPQNSLYFTLMSISFYFRIRIRPKLTNSFRFGSMTLV
jgi:hypothetical protein